MYSNKFVYAIKIKPIDDRPPGRYFLSVKLLKIPHQVDLRVVRGSALVVVLSMSIAVVFGSAWIAGFLALDFFIRGFLAPRYSVVSLISRHVVVPLTGFERRTIYFPPKRFAARVGFVFALTSSVLFAVGYADSARIVAGALILFASMECFFNICVGCIVHSWLHSVARRIRG